MNNQNQKSGQKGSVLTKLSSTESSQVSSRDSSSGGDNNSAKKNRRNRRRSQTPSRNDYNNKQNYNQRKQHQRSNSKRRSWSRRSRSFGRRDPNQSITSNKYQTIKKKAWKSKICRYWKKGQCRFGDQCEWQHYDFTQIDYCEINKRERYNQTFLNGKYLVQTTTVQYMDENQIMNLIGTPQQIKQQIAIAIKNKKQSKQMKKEIQKEIRKGNPNKEEKIEIKKRIIKQYINLIQKDVANEIAIKRIQKKEELKNIRLKKKEQQEGRMITETEEKQKPESTEKSNTKSYKQQQNQYLVVNKQQQQEQTYQCDDQPLDSTYYQENQFAEEKSYSYESNLYINKIDEQKEQQQKLKEKSQTQQQKQQQLKTISSTQGPILTQKKITFTQQTESDLLQGTGEQTQTMEDRELIQYYQYDQIEKMVEVKLVQCIHAENWTKENVDAIKNIDREYKDTESNEWDEKALIVMKINHNVFNKEVTTKPTSKNPAESPTYKTKQAIISALLKYLDLKSSLRFDVSSQRTQIFILNRILENKTIMKNTIWVTGMDKREKAQITRMDVNPLCVVIQQK